MKSIHTSASRSNRAKSSFNIFTRSCAEYVDEMAVKPTMSAYRMLECKVREQKWNEKCHPLRFDVKSINVANGEWHVSHLPFVHRYNKRASHFSLNESRGREKSSRGFIKNKKRCNFIIKMIEIFFSCYSHWNRCVFDCAQKNKFSHN